jgi:hypothetical protein
MEKIKNNLNKIVALIVLLFISTFIYNYTSQENNSDLDEITVGPQSEKARDILETLNELGKINIDYSFFYNKGDIKKEEHIFIVNGKEYLLKDFSKSELAPKEFGKNNPFAEENIFKEKSVDFESETVN